MGNVISVIDALAEEKTGGENIEPKVMTADLAQSLYAGELRVPVNANMPRTGAMTNFMYGLVDTADAFVNDTPEQIKILGGQYDVVMGGLKGDEERIKRGRMNMDTANRNLQFNQQQRDMLTPDAAKDTFGYALGSGVASYGTMVVGGYGGGAAARALGASAKAAGRATGAAAYGTMAAMEVGGEVQERADKYAADTGDNAFKNYEPEKALKNLAAESAYGTISVILEKYLGFGEQRKLFNLDLAKLKSPTLRATASLTKTGVKTAVSEAGTEFAQSLANMGIDLIDGTMDWEQVPDRLKQELTGWAAAAVIGGTAGVGVGIYNRSRGIRAIKEEIRGTVPDADLERTASAIFDSAAEKMADVVSVELELSSQLRNKHGSVMDSMQRAVKQAVDESGAFADIGEDVLAEYVVDTSKLFADQVLAEANIRNVPIEEVIKASDIVYENGGIRLKSQTEKGEPRILADSSVNVEGEQQLLLQEAYDSNGKADINTPEFKAWFGNSKVVDEKGRPKTYWHGSLWNFDRFKQHNGDYNFSPDERFAYNYAESKAFEEGKVKYIRDKKNSLLTGHNAYLSQADSNILQKSDIVNSFMQQKPQPKGLYDASKGIIRIFETADFSTLPHEMAHYWLDNMWSYVRSGNASEKYRQRWNVIANWLNVRPEQTILTRGQQEKFARGYEQYLLNGNLPIPIIKGAFDDYDRWLKRVYGDMNRLNIRLSEDAVRFFQSMTTGVLPPPQIKPARKPRGKMTRAEKLREQLGLREQDKQEQEAVKFVEEMEAARPLPDSVDERTVIVSNITEGEPGKSRVYSREVERNIDTLQEIADIDLEYNKIKLEEQAQRAAEYVKNNLEDARKIIDGRKAAPENILDTAIRIAYEQEMLRIGDNAEYLRALKLHSSLQTLRGQEIVAERISTKDIASPTYWINKLVAHRTYKAASKIFKGYTEAVGGDSPLDSYKKMIKEETAKITKKVLAETTREGQQRVLESELKRLRYEYGTGEQGELFQMPTEPLNARNAKMYIREALDDVFGTTVSQEEANQIIGKIGEIEKSIVNTLDETGNPSVQTWQKINEMNNLVEGLTPSPALQIFSSIIARGAMLASIKSPVLNVISNTENILTEMLIRRAVNSLEGGASFSAVDKSVEKDYLAYADDVYRASGYNVSTTEGLDAATITLGERRISTQGAGKFRAFARGVETGVFKYMMGYPDSRAKDFVFSDAAALEATTIAQNEGLSGEALSKRATELYKDTTRVAPLTEEGMVIREKAMMEANVATYTNDTAFSKFALGIRETLNRATGNVRLGDQLMPFVKTPANVVALGVEYSIGAAYLIPNLTTVIRDVKAGKLSAKSRTAIKAAVRNGLGVVLAMLIAMALDPDDYTPDYDALTMSERRLALEKNAVFNSIRIGDKYISLDYFGPLAIPLTAVLSARRREETGWFGYAKGVASQLQKLPGLKEYSEAVDAVGRAVSNTPEKTIKNLNNAMIDFIRARTIPSIVNDLAKSIDTYERETSAGTYDKAKASVPGIREELPLKYTTTSRTPKETEAALSILLFGARVKTAASNRVIYEIDRLYKKDAKPTITDVTRSGKLSELSEAKQQRVRKEFAKRYYDGVYTLIRTREYRAKDDEQRAAAINKVRRRIIDQLKKEYIR